MDFCTHKHQVVKLPKALPYSFDGNQLVLVIQIGINQFSKALSTVIQRSRSFSPVFPFSQYFPTTTSVVLMVLVIQKFDSVSAVDVCVCCIRDICMVRTYDMRGNLVYVPHKRNINGQSTPIYESRKEMRQEMKWELNYTKKWCTRCISGVKTVNS